jgi:hypothetical protein
MLLARKTLPTAGGGLCEVGVTGGADSALFAIKCRIQAVRVLDGNSFCKGGAGWRPSILFNVREFYVLECRDINLHFVGRCRESTRGVRGTWCTGITADGREGGSGLA